MDIGLDSSGRAPDRVAGVPGSIPSPVSMAKII